MLTDRQRSFTARLKCDGYPISFNTLKLVGEVIEAPFGHHGTATANALTAHASLVPSDYLCLNSKAYPVLLYFRYVSDSYNVYVRQDDCPKYGKCLQLSGGWVIASDAPTGFRLVKKDAEDCPIYLDQHRDATGSIGILVPGGSSWHSLLRQDTLKEVDYTHKYAYLCTQGKAAYFSFEDITWNVPWVSSPDER